MLIILCGPAMSWSLHNGSRIFLGTSQKYGLVKYDRLLSNKLYGGETIRWVSIHKYRKGQAKTVHEKINRFVDIFAENALEAFSLLYNSATIFSIFPLHFIH